MINKMYVTTFINFVLLLVLLLEMSSHNGVIFIRQRLNEDVVSYMMPMSFLLSSMFIVLDFSGVLYDKVWVIVWLLMNNFLDLV